MRAESGVRPTVGLHTRQGLGRVRGVGVVAAVAMVLAALAFRSGVRAATLTPAQTQALDTYHHYADFTASQCLNLPPGYVKGCLYGAAEQAANPAVAHESLTERERLYWEYTHGDGFSLEGCTLLPTDSVEGCQEAMRARMAKAEAAANRTQQAELQLYHDYYDFTVAQCHQLPPLYVQGCLYGAEQQAKNPAVARESRSQRVALFYEYTHGAGFSYTGCTLLPTDSVEGCQERFPARPKPTAAAPTRSPSKSSSPTTSTTSQKAPSSSSSTPAGSGTVPIPPGVHCVKISGTFCITASMTVND